MKYLVFTDLDGTLLDHETYSFEAARPALALLEEKSIPLIFCTSKTRAEIEETRLRLGNAHPFISENGGAVFIPRDYFPFSIDCTREDKDLLVIELGTEYPRIRKVLGILRNHFPGKIEGFGDMNDDEVARLTGLSPAQARLARRREYDEPFVFSEEEGEVALRRIAAEHGLSLTRGGRFFHLTGENDKGRAVSVLTGFFRRLEPDVQTVGLGDSLNDLPMLEAVDRPVLVQRPDGSHDPRLRIDGLIPAPGIGPAGWNTALLELLNRPQET